MNPDSSDYFTTSDDSKNWIEFEFPETISITEVTITNPDNSGHLMKNWRLSAIAGEDDSTGSVIAKGQCDGRNGKSVSSKCKVLPGRIFTLEQVGHAWDGGNAVAIRSVEFKAEGKQYRSGVFHAMLERSDGDPHRMGVTVTANEHDFSLIHKKGSRNVVRTYSKPSPPWIQFEFIDAAVTVEGYRIKTCSSRDRFVLKGSSSARGSPEWEVIEPQSDESNGDHLLIVRCDPGEPYRVIRLVLDEPHNSPLSILHVDLFGTLESEDDSR
jgi:hypothetical protein